MITLRPASMPLLCSYVHHEECEQRRELLSTGLGVTCELDGTCPYSYLSQEWEEDKTVWRFLSHSTWPYCTLLSFVLRTLLAQKSRVELYDRRAYRIFLSILQSVPSPLKAIHDIDRQSSTFQAVIMPQVFHLMGHLFRKRYVLHVLVDTESLLISLRRFGLASSMIPTSLGGQLSVQSWRHTSNHFVCFFCMRREPPFVKRAIV